MRITLELGSGVDPDMIIPGLLRHTNLQTTNKVQMHFLDEHGVVRLYNLRTVLQAWVAHRIRVVVARSENRLAKIAERLHRLRGFLAVLVDIDETIRIVRTSKTRAVARERLCERFEIDEIQANAVLDLNLGQLTEDSVIEFNKETDELEKEQAKLELLLSSEQRQRTEVARGLRKVMEEFTDDIAPRVTTITTEEAPKVSKAAMVIDQPIQVYVDASGWVQGIRRGSKAKPKLVPLHTFDTSTATTMVVITTSGQLIRTLVDNVPEKPTAAASLLPGLEGEPLVWWLEADMPDDLLLVMSDGMVKRIAASDCEGGDRKGGISIVKLAAGSRLVSIGRFDEATPVVLVADSGQGIRFVPSDMRQMGRAAAGVKGIKLGPGEQVVFGGTVTGDTILLATDKKHGKRFAVDELPEQGRAGKGVKVMPAGRWGKAAVGAFTEAAGDVLVIDGDDQPDPVTISIGAFPQVARDAKPGKIRMHDVPIRRIVTPT